MLEMLKNYINIAKPGIIFGNLVSTAGGFFLAAKGRIDIAVLLATLSGVSLVVASACVFNNYVDRSLDRKMVRTRDRPLAKGTMSLKAALFYALFLGISGAALLWITANLLSTAIVLTGFTIYVGVYSLFLKRNSLYGALAGSLAGAAPPLAGYCAVSNHLDPAAAILLSIFILWQIPHSYSITISWLDDYAAAAIPALPIKHGITAAKRHVVGYIVAFVAAAPMLTFYGYTGYSYLAVATGLGLFWLYLAWSGHKTSDDRLWARKIYVFSILAIFALSVMMSVDFKAPPKSNLFLSYLFY